MDELPNVIDHSCRVVFLNKVSNPFLWTSVSEVVDMNPLTLDQSSICISFDHDIENDTPD